MMQEPRLEADAFFRPDMLKRYVKAPPRDQLNIYCTSDFATGKGDDWTVHTVFGVDAEDNIYVLDVWRSKSTSDIWITKALEIAKEWEPRQWGMPNDLIFKSIAPALRKEMRDKRVYFSIEEMTESGLGDKTKKARGIQARAGIGKLWVPAAAGPDDYTPPEWLADFEPEVIMFPMAKNDDQVDTLSLCGRMLDDMNAKRQAQEPVEMPRIPYAKKRPDPRKDWMLG
jgi:phage terminase large subunit-like protein